MKVYYGQSIYDDETGLSDTCDVVLYADARAVEEGRDTAKASNRELWAERDRLKKRLKIAEPHPFGDGYDALDLATDRIAALTTEVEAKDRTIAILEQANKELTAELAGMREALRWFIPDSVCSNLSGISERLKEICMTTDCPQCPIAKARQALGKEQR